MKELKEALSKGEIRKVILALKEIVKDDVLREEILAIEGRLNYLRSNINRGVISYDQQTLDFNKISSALGSIIAKLENTQRANRVAKNTEKSSRLRNYIFISSLTLAFITIGYMYRVKFIMADCSGTFRKEEAKNSTRNSKKYGNWMEVCDSSLALVLSDDLIATDFYRLVSYDKDGRPCSQSRAFYKDGKRYWVGKFFDINGPSFDKLSTWYFPNGNVMKKVLFKEGNEWYKEIFDDTGDVQYYKVSSPSYIDTLISRNPYEDIVIYYDSFQKNQSNWVTVASEYRNIYLQNGKYILQNNDEQLSAHSLIEIPLNTRDNFNFKVVTSWHEGVDNFPYGLVFGSNGNNSEYQFVITADGYFNFYHLFEGEFKNIMKYKRVNNTTLMNKGLNTLEISKSGDHYSLSINGFGMGNIPFSGFYGNKLGLVVHNEQKVSFDNLEVSVR